MGIWVFPQPLLALNILENQIYVFGNTFDIFCFSVIKHIMIAVFNYLDFFLILVEHSEESVLSITPVCFTNKIMNITRFQNIS